MPVFSLQHGKSSTINTKCQTICVSALTSLAVVFMLRMLDAYIFMTNKIYPRQQPPDMPNFHLPKPAISLFPHQKIQPMHNGSFIHKSIITDDKLMELANPNIQHMYNIFLDIGANIGDTFEELVQYPNHYQFNARTWMKNNRDVDIASTPQLKVILFEASSKFTSNLTSLAKQYPNIISKVYPETAVWIENDYLTFVDAETKKHDAGSVSNSALIHNDQLKHSKVESIDICWFLLRQLKCNDENQNFWKYNRLVLKIDIEGAEYPVLERILNHLECLKCVANTAVLYVEWHPWGQDIYVGLNSANKKAKIFDETKYESRPRWLRAKQWVIDRFTKHGVSVRYHS